MNRSLRRQYEWYKENLNNYRTVLKDTRGKVSRTIDLDYNCMSYALGCFGEWLRLKSFSCLIDDDYFYFEASPQEKHNMLEEMLRECSMEIITRFNCRLLSEPTAAKPRERVIAFRLGYDDFHFARLNSDGTWTHKPGGNYIREMSEEELYSEDCWCPNRNYPYESSIVFFAIQK